MTRRYADEAWRSFPAALNALLAGPPRVTTASLAARLGVSEERVISWRRGRSRPDLRFLPLIATEVGAMRGEFTVDPALLLRRMGVLPDPPSPSEAVQASIRLQQVELRLADSLARLRAFRRTESAASVVAAAQNSGNWAVAVWPTWEGPDGHRMHVADRLDFRRLDGMPADVWADHDLRLVLRNVYATPSGAHPRWTDHDETASVQFWAIHHVAAPRSPTIARPWPGLESIACYAIGDDVWAHDVGAMLAMVLGYGLTTTRDLAVDMGGVMHPDGREDGGTGEATHLDAGRRQRQAEAMAEAHAAIAVAPRQRRVWTHHGTVVAPELVFAQVTRHPSGGVVWLRETDRHLASLADRGAAERISALRSELDRLVPDDRRMIVIPVDHVEDRHLRWERAMGDVATIVRTWVERGILPGSGVAYAPIFRGLAEDRGIGDVLLDWLARRDSLFATLPVSRAVP